MINITENPEIVSRNPRNNEVVKSYSSATEDEIKQTIKDSRKAFESWSNLSVEERTDHLSNIRKSIIENLDDIVSDIKKDTGKVDNEVLMSDILPTLDIIKYYEDNAEEILSKDKKKTPRTFRKNHSYVEYKPLGVILVISPWNYPLQLSMVPALSALVAGSTVVLKPSEVTPFVGEIADLICQESGLPDNVFQVVQGGGDVGKKLINADPDKIFFTGSVRTGKKIMEAASKDLIPVELEMGGKDPMIVFEDADLDRAVEGAVYGAFANSGQLCVSIERLYVQDSIYDEFVERVAERVEDLRFGNDKDSDIGPMIYPQQVDVVDEHLDDALDKGAELLTERKREDLFYYPQVLRNVDHSMKIMQDETFGPVLPIMPFSTEEEAIELANDTSYGLNSSVWTEDTTKAKKVVNQLRVGNSYINDVIKNVGNPHLPFGGVKDSGIGFYHGEEGLRRFCIRTSVMINKRSDNEVNWFPYTDRFYKNLTKIIHTEYGDIGFFEKIKNLISLYREL